MECETTGFVSHKNDSNLKKSYLKKTSMVKHAENRERELKTMLHFHTNPYIVQASCPHLHFETNTDGVALCYIYMEYASLGSLDKMISDAGGRLNENFIRPATRMIIQGLKALHSEGYVHCDLKASNVFVFSSNLPKEPCHLKLTGFGLCKEPNMDSRILFPGTHEYMLPEAIDERCNFCGADRLMTPAYDIWSLGRTVLKMFGGIPQEKGHCIDWKIIGRLSPQAIDFWTRCCASQPTHRPTLDELLDHPFVTQTLPYYLATELLHSRRHDLIPEPQGSDRFPMINGSIFW